MSTAPGRPRGFDREAALEAALLVFWEHGYEASSIAELTRAMGIRPPSLYAAFGDKRALFDEALARYRRTYGAFTDAALAEEPSSYAAIARLLREAAVAYADPAHPRGCLVISAAVTTGPGAEDVREALREFREAGKHALAERIRQDVRTGVLPAHADAEGLATFYAAVLQGMSNQSRDGASTETLGRVAELALTAWPPVK